MKMKKGVVGVAAALAAILMVASGCSSSGGSIESGTGATSTAHNIPRGTLSIIPTSSTIGIFFSSLLLIKTPSSRWTMAPVMLNILLYRLMSTAAVSKETSAGITTITSSASLTVSKRSIL